MSLKICQNPFDSIMSDYSFIMLAQSAAILTWICVVKRQKRNIPEFDSWLFRRLQNDPSVSMEKAFNEYIRDYNLFTEEETGEPAMISQARRKLQLIEKYNLDEIYSGDELYKNYKRKLQKTVNLLPQAVFLN